MWKLVAIARKKQEQYVNNRLNLERKRKFNFPIFSVYAIFLGKSEVRHGKVIQVIANRHRKSQRTNTTLKGLKHFKEQEKQELASYITEKQLWVDHIDLNQYVYKGVEQKVYLHNQKICIQIKRFHLLQFLERLFTSPSVLLSPFM